MTLPNSFFFFGINNTWAALCVAFWIFFILFILICWQHVNDCWIRQKWEHLILSQVLVQYYNVITNTRHYFINCSTTDNWNHQRYHFDKNYTYFLRKNAHARMRAHTHTHTHWYIYIYISHNSVFIYLKYYSPLQLVIDFVLRFACCDIYQKVFCTRYKWCWK